MAKKAIRRKSEASRTKPSKKKTMNRATGSRNLAPAIRGPHGHQDNGICACDVVMEDNELTPDAQLPAAKGGVEIIAARRRDT